MAEFDSVCAALCLLTRAAPAEDMPPPLSRGMMSRLLSAGALAGLVLRETDLIDAALLDRARLLLSRAKSVYRCLEIYLEQGYEVILPQDDLWPERLFVLGARMPQFLFLRGNRSLLSARKIAVAGSREIPASVVRSSYDIGRRIAGEGFCLVCGGARGVDMAAQRGAMDGGGALVLVPAQPEKRLFEDPEYQAVIGAGRMLIVYDSLPDDPFSPQRAIARNHTIYALGEAAIAVAPRDGVGGTWRGALDCLSMGGTPVFVPRGESLGGAGGEALVSRGARWFDPSLALEGQLLFSRQTDLFSVI